MANCVIRTDKMLGTVDPAALISVKYMPGASAGTATAIDNGNVVVVGGLISGEREVRRATTPTVSSALSTIAVIATPEVMYDERKKNLTEFTNAAGDICRAYRLHSGDNFSVTSDGLSAAATIAVGNIVELAADTKLKVVSTLTSGSTKVGEIIAIETSGLLTYYVIEVA